MSIASEWDERLRHRIDVEQDDLAGHLLNIRFEDLRALVDDALELEQLGASLKYALENFESPRLQAVFERTRERCAKLLENGHFLHDQAPAKLLATEAAKAIRALEFEP